MQTNQDTDKGGVSGFIADHPVWTGVIVVGGVFVTYKMLTGIVSPVPSSANAGHGGVGSGLVGGVFNLAGGIVSGVGSVASGILGSIGF